MAVLVATVPQSLAALSPPNTPPRILPDDLTRGIHLNVVAAVVGGLTHDPSASASASSEYRLVHTNKRKSLDDRDRDDEPLPFGHVAKKQKPDDALDPSFLAEPSPFCTLPPFPSPLSFPSSHFLIFSPVDPPADAFHVSVEDALAAILSIDSLKAHVVPGPYIEELILPPSDLQPASPGSPPPSLLPPENPAPALEDDDSAFFFPTPEDDAEQDVQYPIPYHRLRYQPRSPRYRNPPMWIAACKTRVQQMYVVVFCVFFLNLTSWAYRVFSVRTCMAGRASDRA